MERTRQEVRERRGRGRTTSLHDSSWNRRETIRTVLEVDELKDLLTHLVTERETRNNG